jgi:hypothetical protein
LSGRIVLLRQAAKKRIALAVITALAATGALASAAAPAQAQYYWGCTYSWGAPCFENHVAGINFLITMDPDHAVHNFANAPTNNGYKTPKYDGRERCVASAIWYNGRQVVPWVSNWGQTVVTYPEYITGQGLIGSCVEYYNIALYQMVDYGEYGG